MRRILALATLALAGCASMTNESFDNLEAARYSDVSTVARNLSEACQNSAVIRPLTFLLMSQADAAYHYSSVKVNNARATEAGQIVFQFTVDLNTRYRLGDPSEAYCKLKAGLIEQAADIVARSISKKETKSPFAIP